MMKDQLNIIIAFSTPAQDIIQDTIIEGQLTKTQS